MQTVPRGGEAFFWCRPGSVASNVTYNVTWVHRHHVINWARVDRIVYEDGRPIIEPDANGTDHYHFISRGDKDFLFIIDDVTEASVGQVKCFA